MGIPSVPVITNTFEVPVRESLYGKGMQNLRVAFVKHPVAYRPSEECRQKLLGKDPVSGKQVLQEIVDHLTLPLNEEEMKTGSIERPRSRILGADTEENFQELFRNNGWTLYLPITVPTEERVEAMLKGTSRKPDEKVGEMAPSSPHEKWSYTVEQVAVNAVMAGAKPEHFPVILAIASIGQTALFTSTNSFTAMVCVNGPIRNEIKMNMSIGTLGPFNHANTAIGAAWTLISKNLGGGVTPGLNYMGSQGQGHNFTNLCFGEREERLPEGWKPFHVLKGYKPEESVVSVFHGWSWSNMGGFESWKDQTIRIFFEDNFQCCGASIVMDPLVAMMLHDDLGYKTKEEFNRWLKENVKFDQKQYWGFPGQFPEGGHPEELAKAKAGEEPYASWLKLPEGVTIPVARQLDVNIMVAGGETNPYWQAGSLGLLGTASVDEWR
jgi:hypothetical protein